MLLLTGEYEHIIDDKGRVLVSNKLRSQIDADEHGCSFYLVVGANGILCLYPEKCFELLSLAMAQKNTAPDETVAFERMNFALAGKVELDSQGRLLLNEKLRKRAGLKDFDKGDGIKYLDKELNLDMNKGPHLICGDTGSDLPMIEATMERTNDTWSIFVTKNQELVERVKAVCPNALIVSEPDILVTILNQLSTHF